MAFPFPETLLHHNTGITVEAAKKFGKTIH